MFQFTKNLYFCNPIFGKKKQKNTTIMKEQIEEKNTEMGNVITRSEEFIQKNQKKITIIAAAIVAVALIVFCVIKFYIQPREQRASEEMFFAENYYNAGDFEKALNGDDSHRGFISIIDNYGCTKAGNLAKYYAGIASLRMGNYDDAAKYLDSYKGKDLYTKPIAIMAEADAEVERGNTDAAVKLYLKAAATNENEVSSPAALFKAGVCYIMLNNNEKAVECLKHIKTKFPRSIEAQNPDTDRMIAIAETM